MLRNGDSPLSLLDPLPSAASASQLYAALVDALPDPILVVAGSRRDDLTGRRFVLANAAARELLRLTADEGMLLSAVRDPAVLGAVDKALFDVADAESAYETTGAQSRSLRVRARPLEIGRAHV